MEITGVTVNAMGEVWMRRAIALATENVRSGAGGPFGAVVVRAGEMIAEGVNSVVRAHDPTAHAEVVAIRNACLALGSFELRGCAIYSSAEPCPMCLAAIYWSRIGAIYYGNTAEDTGVAGFDDARLYAEFRLDRASRGVVAQCLLREEAAASFVAWSESPMRQDY